MEDCIDNISGIFTGICGNVAISISVVDGSGIDVLVFVVVQPITDSFCIDLIVFDVVQPTTETFVLKR